MSEQKNLFKTPYQKEKEHAYIPTGDGKEIQYGYEINKTGQKVLVAQGITDRYAKIQENLESTLIENVLRSVAAGDNSVLRPQGIYADCTEQPRTLIEARKMILNLENTWNGLTTEQRRAFNNDVEKFVAESGNVEWFKKLGLVQETSNNTEHKQEEIKTNEATISE